MEWLGTNVSSSPAGAIEATVEWLDPSPEFLLAVQMSALNRLPMPIPNGPANGINVNLGMGCVIEYSWTHEHDPKFLGGPVANPVRLSVRFNLLP